MSNNCLETLFTRFSASRMNFMRFLPGLNDFMLFLPHQLLLGCRQALVDVQKRFAPHPHYGIRSYVFVINRLLFKILGDLFRFFAPTTDKSHVRPEFEFESPMFS